MFIRDTRLICRVRVFPLNYQMSALRQGNESIKRKGKHQNGMSRVKMHVYDITSDHVLCNNGFVVLIVAAAALAE
jgi:hypothetical protein